MAPQVVEAIPASRSHIDLSVGVPVKNFFASEPSDSEAARPKANNAIPTASHTIPKDDFMGLILVVRGFNRAIPRDGFGYGFWVECSGLRVTLRS